MWQLPKKEMHAWPSHHHLPKQTKKKKKFLVKNYPVLDHGVIGAATLVERNGKLEWDSLVSAHPAGMMFFSRLIVFSTPHTVIKANRYRLTKTLDIFPATKSTPILEPAVTVARRADQGVCPRLYPIWTSAYTCLGSFPPYSFSRG